MPIPVGPRTRGPPIPCGPRIHGTATHGRGSPLMTHRDTAVDRRLPRLTRTIGPITLRLTASLDRCLPRLTRTIGTITFRLTARQLMFP